MNARNRVSIEEPALRDIRNHLINSYPLEGCGVLLGPDNATESIQVSRAIGTRNADTIRGHDRFTIDPRDLIKIERELKGERVVGFFHSHPDAPSIPSATDLDAAQGLFDVARTFYVYAIASVTRDKIAEMRFWRLTDNLERFEEIA